MPSKGFSAEQIVTPLRQIEVLIAQAKSAPGAGRERAYRSRTTRRAAER